MRRFGQELCDIISQRFRHDRGRRQHPHFTAHACRVARHRALDALRGGEHFACMLQQGLPGSGGLDAVTATLQQPHTHRVFELRKPLADRRADDVCLLRRACDVARFADDDEEAEGG